MLDPSRCGSETVSVRARVPHSYDRIRPTTLQIDTHHADPIYIFGRRYLLGQPAKQPSPPRGELKCLIGTIMRSHRSSKAPVDSINAINSFLSISLFPSPS